MLTSKLEQDSHFFVANFLSLAAAPILLFEIGPAFLVGMGGKILLLVGFL